MQIEDKTRREDVIERATQRDASSIQPLLEDAMRNDEMTMMGKAAGESRQENCCTRWWKC